jgi:signal-transduction protein with cAMP-binding, CBS, and nucleotidyltransferase domain
LTDNPATRLFRIKAAQCLASIPASVGFDTPAGVAMARMRAGGCDSALVTDSLGRLVGVLHARDVATADAVVAAGTLATPSPPAAGSEDPLSLALASMRRHALSSLPVVDSGGRPLGLLSLEALLDLVTAGLPALLQQLAQDEEADALLSARNRQAELAATLRNDLRVPAPEILATIATLNDRIYQCVVRQCLARMNQQGWGPPPVAFAVIVMGSLARRECMLSPDQDNGFVLEDYPDDRLLAIDGYFQELAARMTIRLDQVGLPLCKGQVMATNPSWRKRSSEWQAQFAGWLRKPSHASTMLTDICIDFRWVYGDADLVAALRRFTSRQIPRHHGFLRELERLQSERDVAVTPFRTLKRERLPGTEDDRQVDIKRKGIMPLVEGIRLLALKAGVDSCSTTERLAELVSRDALDPDLAAELGEAFTTLTGLLLDRQILDHRRGRIPGAYLSPEQLSATDNRRLRSALVTATRLRGKVHSDFTAEIC